MKQTGTVLVTGGCGFIGSNFIRFLFERTGFSGNVVNLDKLTYAGRPENVADIQSEYCDRYHFLCGDIADRAFVENIFHKFEIRIVVHFAAESHVDRSISGSAPFMETNILGTWTLLEAARMAWGDHADPETFRFHHVSTDEVFGQLMGDDPGFTETTPYDPRSPYSASKASSDHLVRAWYHTYGLPVTISNCSNNYGPYQFPEKLIPVVILNALNKKPIPIYGDGKNIRDWLYVEDHCEAICRILESGIPGETYNIGGNCELANIDLVHAICGIMDELSPVAVNSAFGSYRELISFVTDRPGHDRRYAMDTGKIQRELNWEAVTGIEDGLTRTVEWYMKNQNWVNAVRS
ncbi:MAG: dTDP-glucose 4,6-dehydratase [Acidobacteria bacterium]|nr:dTDP-glucose 4,6-dehydratase [Acidobacteriota bacterium]